MRIDAVQVGFGAMSRTPRRWRSEKEQGPNEREAGISPRGKRDTQRQSTKPQIEEAGKMKPKVEEKDCLSGEKKRRERKSEGDDGVVELSASDFIKSDMKSLPSFFVSLVSSTCLKLPRLPVQAIS